MPQLSTEVQRLEELKIQNMQNVVESLREEMAQYWTMCFYSPEQREAFTPYYSGKLPGLKEDFFKLFCNDLVFIMPVALKWSIK